MLVPQCFIEWIDDGWSVSCPACTWRRPLNEVLNIPECPICHAKLKVKAQDCSGKADKGVKIII
ncbi:MAG: hypothetical protein GY863_13855 [bacterium]|nr:hypothetical protein [bacterium]